MKKMPEISRFFGIRITMFFEEHNPPHFHARYQGFKAVYSINDCERMQGSMPTKVENIIVSWAKQYRNELEENWKSMKKGGTFKKIKGADQ